MDLNEFAQGDSERQEFLQYVRDVSQRQIDTLSARMAIFARGIQNRELRQRYIELIPDETIRSTEMVEFSQGIENRIIRFSYIQRIPTQLIRRQMMRDFLQSILYIPLHQQYIGSVQNPQDRRIMENQFLRLSPSNGATTTPASNRQRLEGRIRKEMTSLHQDFGEDWLTILEDGGSNMTLVNEIRRYICSITTDLFPENAVILGSSLFNRQGITKWLDTHGKCPNTAQRRSIKQLQPLSQFILQGILNALLDARRILEKQGQKKRMATKKRKRKNDDEKDDEKLLKQFIKEQKMRAILQGKTPPDQTEMKKRALQRLKRFRKMKKSASTSK